MKLQIKPFPVQSSVIYKEGAFAFKTLRRRKLYCKSPGWKNCLSPDRMSETMLCLLGEAGGVREDRWLQGERMSRTEGNAQEAQKMKY